MRIVHALPAALLFAFPVHAETTLRVMSFNIWGGGGNESKGIEETVAAIKASGADIVGLQETRLEPEDCTAENCAATGDSVAPAIAAALGWNVYDQTQENVALWANAVVSRYPIGAASVHDLGVPIDVDGRMVWVFNIHHDDEPYQPYQLLGIEYGPAPFIKTEAEAVDYANQTRGPAMDLLARGYGAGIGCCRYFRDRRFQRTLWSGLDRGSSGGRPATCEGGVSHHQAPDGSRVCRCLPRNSSRPGGEASLHMDPAL